MPGGRNGWQKWGGHQPNGWSRREDHWGDGGAYGFRGGGPGTLESCERRKERERRALPQPTASAPRSSSGTETAGRARFALIWGRQ
eukprot:COSAG02_NODE_12023_length_1611_cov_1.497354_2_plen_86_part_00